MKPSWTQPSLLRDFVLLTLAVVFLLALISGWVTYSTYQVYSGRIAADLDKDSAHIEQALANEMENANYMLTALGKQIVIDGNSRDLTRLAQTLKSFDSKGYIYSIFSWIGTDQRVLVSSNKGVLERPVDVSDRDYVQQSVIEPWKMYVGRPIEGRVSERWVIPVAMGLTDYTGKFIGTIMISLDINALTNRLSGLLKREGLSFAVVSKTLMPLAEVSDNKDFVSNVFPISQLNEVNFSSQPSGVIERGSLLLGAGNYFYYRMAGQYPYVILLGYDTHHDDVIVRGVLWSRLLQLAVIAAFFIAFLYIMRARMIRPVLDLTAAAAAVARGGRYEPGVSGGPEEIQALSTQLHHISEYIEEGKRIEDELRHKMFMLKHAKENSEEALRGKSEFLAYVCQEMRHNINMLIALSQAMRDQLHGPVENRKYRQNAVDMYQASQSLLQYTQDLLTLAKTETGYAALVEKPVDVREAANKTLRFLADKLQAENRRVRVTLPEAMPKLYADEFRLQEILANALLYITQRLPEGAGLALEARLVSENRESQFFVITLMEEEMPPPSASDLADWAETLARHNVMAPPQENKTPEHNISLALVISLMALHQGYCGTRAGGKDAFTLALFFPGSRIKAG